MCSVDWELVVNALAAIGSVGAALAALYIATKDRRERRRASDAADEAQARLVWVGVDRLNGEAGFKVRIRNYGDRPILDVGVTEASLHRRPDARWRNLEEWTAVLPPFREGEESPEVTSSLTFFDTEGEPIPKLIGLVDLEPLFEEVDTTPIVAVMFTDANGNDWTTGSFMGPERVERLQRREWRERWLRRRPSLADDLRKLRQGA